MSPARVNAPGPPDFALHTLGWRAFQDLSGALLAEVMGQSFQVFADSRDAGRDGAFYGMWRPVEGALDGPVAGPFAMQCKHTIHEAATMSLSSLTDELKKVPQLVERGLCHSYLLVTNARVTGQSETAIGKALSAAGVARPFILSGPWICRQIAESQRLRRYVPRVYGLGDLTMILDQRAYDQAVALIDYLRDDLSTFVVTAAYRQAAEALSEHGFVLLLGSPGVGKSVIASTLAMTALDSWGCLPVRAHSAAELLAHWNPLEPGQLFWIDDAFGNVRHDWNKTDDWATRLSGVMAAIKGGARVIVTSRDYIYQEARVHLKEYAYPLLKEQQVVVDVEALTRYERQQIVYNHVRFGDQPTAVRSSLKLYLDSAADVDPFRPEAARRLGQQAFTRGLTADEQWVTAFMQNPGSYLEEVYAELSQAQRAVLSLVYMNGHLTVPLGGNPDIQAGLARFGIDEDTAATALATLEGTVLRRAEPPGTHSGEGWSFRHPTLKEGFANYIGRSPARLDILVAGMSAYALLAQVDCGSNEQGTLVSIPESMYRQVARRIASCRSQDEVDYDDIRREFLRVPGSTLFRCIPSLVPRRGPGPMVDFALYRFP